MSESAVALTVAEAPGRVNLIGEHTDYHQGFVLPMPIPQRTIVHLRPRDDRRVHVSSSAAGNGAEEYDIGREQRGRGWLDYVQGVTAVLGAEGFDLRGFDATVESNVPLGAGVSSSAALEVSLLKALRAALHFDLGNVDLARIAQKAETDFVGAPVGIMDQMVCSLGQDGHALFLDTRTLATEQIPLSKHLRVVVIDSGITHSHAGGEYGTRRRESFEAAAKLGVKWLRDVGMDALPTVNSLPDPLSRRARHIVTENHRVLAAVRALQDDDPAHFGRLSNESHASMRDDYEITTPDIDTLVTIAQRRPDVYGARMTGGGFGGAIVVIGKDHLTTSGANEICSQYASLTGRKAAVLVAP
jgi:galactokinase